MSNITKSEEYINYLVSISKNESPSYQGLIPYLKTRIFVPKALIISKEQNNWEQSGEMLSLEVIVLGYNHDYDDFPPIVRYDALFIKKEEDNSEHLKYCGILEDYLSENISVLNHSIITRKDITIDQFTDYEEAEKKVYIHIIKRLENFEKKYYIDSMNKYEFSQKKYYEYKQIEKDELINKREKKRNSIKSLFGSAVFIVIVILIFQYFFK